jgi:Zn-dependent protease with chaperone function
MAVALALLALTYAALWFGVYELFREVPGAWPYWIVVTIALATALIGHYRGADKSLLASVGAELVEPGTERELETTVHRLASLADVSAPRLAVADTPAANAFAVGLS